jgi:hypothetical protein
MRGRERLSASVDAELMEAGRTAVAEGQADSLSAWVNEALQMRADNDRRLRALDAFLLDYELEYGEITERQMEEAMRRARASAVVVRTPAG